MEIVREAAEGVCTVELAARFGGTPRTIQYTLKSYVKRQREAAIPTAAVTVKLDPGGTRRLGTRCWQWQASRPARTSCDGIQAAGGTFGPDVNLADESARYRAALHAVGNAGAQIAKQMMQANRMGQGPVRRAAASNLALPDERGVQRDVLAL